ncbi:hypothetical protein N0V88_006662 [Collariella sp. IMI 366227]|nr:hypothetical protein N0V88_006662 [Collariella sp. IMI 366227]
MCRVKEGRVTKPGAAGGVPARRRGRPAIDWTRSRKRRLLRLYLCTPESELSLKRILELLADGPFQPKEVLKECAILLKSKPGPRKNNIQTRDVSGEPDEMDDVGSSLNQGADTTSNPSRKSLDTGEPRTSLESEIPDLENLSPEMFKNPWSPDEDFRFEKVEFLRERCTPSPGSPHMQENQELVRFCCSKVAGCVHQRITAVLMKGKPAEEFDCTADEANTRDGLGNTALHAAARWAAPGRILFRVMERASHLNVTNKCGETFLHALDPCHLTPRELAHFTKYLTTRGFDFTAHDHANRSFADRLLARPSFSLAALEAILSHLPHPTRLALLRPTQPNLLTPIFARFPHPLPLPPTQPTSKPATSPPHPEVNARAPETGYTPLIMLLQGLAWGGNYSDAEMDALVGMMIAGAPGRRWRMRRG